MQSELDHKGQDGMQMAESSTEGHTQWTRGGNGNVPLASAGRLCSPFWLELKSSCGRVVGHKDEKTDHIQTAVSPTSTHKSGLYYVSSKKAGRLQAGVWHDEGGLSRR